MSTVRQNLDLLAPPVVQTIQQRSLLIGVVFAVASVIGAFVAPAQFFHAYLLGYMAWLGLTLGCMSLLMLHYLTSGDWGLVVRRLMEAGTRVLPLMIVLFVPLIVGMKPLYEWARPEAIARDKHLQEIAQAYLNPSGFIWRAVIYFLIWGALDYYLNRWSTQQDISGAPDVSAKLRRISGPGLVLYAFSMTFALIDWVMSLQPHWISTVYGLIILVGQTLSAICFAVVLQAILVRRKPMSEVLQPKHVHDYGNLMLTFVMLWAYLSFSQLLIIWSGNLPEEISWYNRRFAGGWQYVGLFLAIFHFAVPFAMLLSRPFKRKVHSLVWLAVWLMLMRYTDLLWNIEPAAHDRFHVTWLDIVVPIAIGGLWLAYFCRNLKARPLLPLYAARTQALLEPAHE